MSESEIEICAFCFVALGFRQPEKRGKFYLVSGSLKILAYSFKWW
ncbi:MAG: hypothetical protein Q4B82_04890 [Alysiella sp.]|nr:hypothetical protein [Alysiella sp.]MDO4433899.1 hypothetical protein [Alysiella sp.]